MECWQLDLKARRDSQAFPTIKVWISKDDNLVRQTKEYSLSGQHLRTIMRPKYIKVGASFTPETIVVVDELKGKMINGKMEYDKAQITVSNPRIEHQKDTIYSQAFLEKLNG